MTRLGLTIGLCALLVGSPGAQSGAQRLETGWGGDPPAVSALVAFARTASDLRVVVDRYLLDKAAIERRYEVPYSPVRQRRLREFSLAWQKRLAEADFTGLNSEGKIDFVLLRNRIEYDLASLTLADTRWQQMAGLLPFADTLRLLQEDRHDRKRVDPRATATTLTEIARQVVGLTQALTAEGRRAGGVVTRPGITPVIAARAATQVDALRSCARGLERLLRRLRSDLSPGGCGSRSAGSTRR